MDFAGDFGTLRGVVDAPDGGADGDDACKEDTCTEGGPHHQDEAGEGFGRDGHECDADEHAELECGDEWDLAFATGEDGPEEGCDVCECGCGDECAGEVVEDCVVDDAVVELSDDEPDDAAFCRGDCPWHKECGTQLACVVGSGEPGHGVWVE